MKALVGAFNQEKALVGAFSVIVQPVVEPMDRFAALVLVLVPVLAQPQHVLRLAPVLPLGVRPGPALGLDQPQRLHVGDAVLQLELHQRQDLERNPGVDKGLGTVDTLVSSAR